jgi:hypothetical protein
MLPGPGDANFGAGAMVFGETITATASSGLLTC